MLKQRARARLRFILKSSRSRPLAEFPGPNFLRHTRGLLRDKFRVAIPVTIGFGRSTVRFATLRSKIRKLSRPPEARLWRGTLTAWPRLFYVQSRRQAMPKGTVKWFNPTKGYGFIKPTVGDKDVFVHISAVERAGLSTLNENQVVEYDLVENRGKASAENLKVS